MTNAQTTKWAHTITRDSRYDAEAIARDCYADGTDETTLACNVYGCGGCWAVPTIDLAGPVEVECPECGYRSVVQLPDESVVRLPYPG